MQEQEEAAANKAGSEVSSPNQTIYINNLNEKVKLDGTNLFSLFFWFIYIYIIWLLFFYFFLLMMMGKAN